MARPSLLLAGTQAPEDQQIARRFEHSCCSLRGIRAPFLIYLNWDDRERHMLSTKVRQQAEFICSRIEQGHPVKLDDMRWIQKWADHHRTIASMLRSARRRAINSKPHPESLDGLLDALDIGDPDPTAHLSGPQDPTVLAEWFKAPDWVRRD